MPLVYTNKNNMFLNDSSSLQNVQEFLNNFLLRPNKTVAAVEIINEYRTRIIEATVCMATTYRMHGNNNLCFRYPTPMSKMVPTQIFNLQFWLMHGISIDKLCIELVKLKSKS